MCTHSGRWPLISFFLSLSCLTAVDNENGWAVSARAVAGAADAADGGKKGN